MEINERPAATLRAVSNGLKATNDTVMSAVADLLTIEEDVGIKPGDAPTAESDEKCRERAREILAPLARADRITAISSIMGFGVRCNLHGQVLLSVGAALNNEDRVAEMKKS